MTVTGRGAVPNAQILIFDGGVQRTGTGEVLSVLSDGSFVSPPMSFVDGPHVVTLQQVLAGVPGDLSSVIRIDVQPRPPGPKITEPESGLSTAGSSIAISGTGTPGATLTVNGAAVSQRIGDDGKFTVIVPIDGPGYHDVTVAETGSQPTTVKVAKQLPRVIVSQVLPAPSQTAPAAACGTAPTMQFQLVGTATAGLGDVYVADGDGKYFEKIAATAPAGGAFSLSVQLDVGKHMLNVYQERQGLQSPPTVTAVTVAPAAPTGTPCVKSEAVTADSATNCLGNGAMVDNPVTISGTVCPRTGLRASITAYERPLATGSTFQLTEGLVADTGQFALTGVTLSPGRQFVSVKETQLSLSGAGGVESALSPQVELLVRPAAPKISNPVNGAEINPDSSNRLFATVEGTALPGALVTLYVDGIRGRTPLAEPAEKLATCPSNTPSCAMAPFTIQLALTNGPRVITATQTYRDAISRPSAGVSVAAGDETPPKVTVPAPPGLQLPRTPPSPGATVDFVALKNQGLLKAVDDLDGDITDRLGCQPSDATVFPLGSTLVTCSVRDNAGNTGSGTFQVTVKDGSAPTIQVGPIRAEAEGPGGASVQYGVNGTGWVANCAPPGDPGFRPCARWAPADEGIGFSPRAIAVDPSVASRVYAITGEAPIGRDRLLVSNDAGATWALVSSLPAGNVASALTVRGSTMYAATSLGVLRSTNGGLGWGLAIAAPGCRAVLVDPGDDSVIYAAATTGVHRSADGGASWNSISDGLEGRPVLSLALDPAGDLRTRKLYAGIATTLPPKHVLYRRTDEGRWLPVDGIPANNAYRNLPASFLAVSPVDGAVHTAVVRSGPGGAAPGPTTPTARLMSARLARSLSRAMSSTPVVAAW